MDPLTHALMGATVAHASLGKRLGRHAWMLGAVGGVLPDADIFIRSASDPLLAIEYHRQFTHSFVFAPVGGLLAASPWLARAKHRAQWRSAAAAATLGYLTHGLLDACTNYGTQLLWPFSPARIAWHWITTIGPPLTLALLVGLVIAVRRRSRTPAVLALLFGATFIVASAWQREQALTAQSRIAASRGHVIARAEMFPTVGNMLIWRSVYESGGTLYSDRIRIAGSDSMRWKPGYSYALIGENDLPAEQRAVPQVLHDFRRFRYFSDGWVAPSPADSGFLGDARYSLRTDSFEPIWGIRFHPDREQPTGWVDRTGRNRVPLRELWSEITGEVAEYRSIP